MSVYDFCSLTGNRNSISAEKRSVENKDIYVFVKRYRQRGYCSVQVTDGGRRITESWVPIPVVEDSISSCIKTVLAPSRPKLRIAYSEGRKIE